VLPGLRPRSCHARQLPSPQLRGRRGPRAGWHHNTGAGLAAGSATSPRTDGHTPRQPAQHFIWVYDKTDGSRAGVEGPRPPRPLTGAGQTHEWVGCAGVPGQSRGRGPPRCQAAAPSSVSSNTALSEQPSLLPSPQHPRTPSQSGPAGHRASSLWHIWERAGGPSAEPEATGRSLGCGATGRAQSQGMDDGGAGLGRW